MAGTQKLFTTAGNHTGNYTTAPDNWDSVFGSAGADTLGDTLAASAKNHYIAGGEGNDSILATATLTTLDTLFGQAGDDTISAATHTGALYLDGGEGNDSIVAGSGIDTVYAGAGNDIVRNSGAAADIVDLGEGNDTFAGFAAAGESVFGGTGNDSMVAAAGAAATKFDGGDGNDFLDQSGVTVSSTLVGGSGNDTMQAGTAADSVNAGVGNDYVSNAVATVADTQDVIDLGAGDDTFLGATDGGVVAHESIVGGAGNDSIIGRAQIATSTFKVDGGAGDDFISGVADLSGDVNLAGGDGNDTLVGGTVGATLYGNAGNDSIVGGAGVDTFKGGTGNDTLTLGGLADVVGFAAGDGADVITDAAEADVLTLTGVAKSSLTVTATDDKFTLNVSATDSIKFDRGAFAATMTADGTAFTIGNTAAAALAAGANYNTNAAPIFFAGRTSFYNDAVSSAASTGTVTADLRDTTKFYSVEQFNNAANTSYGSVIRGSVGNDTLWAAAAGATGGNGDQLWGGVGNDSLIASGFAAGGHDTLWYGKNEGSDRISGQGSDDIIRLYNVSQSEVSFALDGNDLVVSISGSTDTLRVEDWNAAATAKAKFVTADNMVAFSPTLTSGDTLMGSATAKTTYDLNNYTVNNIDNTGSTSAGNVLRGKASNNVIKASAQGDALYGRTGTDTLIGAAGNDTFWVGAGEGNKTITQYKAGGTDVVKAYMNTQAALTFTDNGTDLVIGYAGSTDTATLAGYTSNATPLTVQTADRTTSFVVSVAKFSDNKVTYDVGTAGNASYHYGSSATNALVYAGAADKTIDLDNAAQFNGIENIDFTTATGIYTMRGTAGVNSIKGGTAADQLWGKAGNDTLTGAGGADTFWFGKDEGNDVIADLLTGGADKVMLYTALTPSDVTSITASGASDLVITMGTGTLTITNGQSLINDSSLLFQTQNGNSYNVRYNGTTSKYELV